MHEDELYKDIYKDPRLFLNAGFEKNVALELSAGQAHYLRNVLRREAGSFVRVFNGVDGEWAGRLEVLGKRGGVVRLEKLLKSQGDAKVRVHLLFAPIKKQRMDFLIEKAVELGVTDLHPVLTARTENRKLNMERFEAQVIEASEQCERLDVPVVHDSVSLAQVIRGWNDGDVLAAIERVHAPVLREVVDGKAPAYAFLIGPEGGFDDSEKVFLEEAPNVQAISLGEAVLRAETASIACLAYVGLVQGGG
ncbi:MAG: 16S rRNA (uracil(1498)-N(3))-methyltransferase [Alphaproteobacteria bacterium]|nr:16S rRNA (uracil(1498)-N(3))-methyltransferase [Alphaproteobacteria bacterium]